MVIQIATFCILVNKIVMTKTGLVILDVFGSQVNLPQVLVPGRLHVVGNHWFKGVLLALGWSVDFKTIERLVGLKTKGRPDYQMAPKTTIARRRDRYINITSGRY